MDYAPSPAGVLGIHSVSQITRADGGLAGEVVAVVEDIKRVTPDLLQATLDALPDTPSIDAIHFIEVIDPVHARLRSFNARYRTDLPDHLPGALAAVMVLDQLSGRLPPEKRERHGRPGAPTTIDFSSGNVLKVEYTNDWGYFYLRQLDGVPEGWKAIKTIPWERREKGTAQIGAKLHPKQRGFYENRLNRLIG